VKSIIAGAGEVGFHIAKKLSEENRGVFLIDKDPEKLCRSPGRREMGIDPLHAGRATVSFQSTGGSERLRLLRFPKRESLGSGLGQNLNDEGKGDKGA